MQCCWGGAGCVPSGSLHHLLPPLLGHLSFCPTENKSRCSYLQLKKLRMMMIFPFLRLGGFSSRFLPSSAQVSIFGALFPCESRGCSALAAIWLHACSTLLTPSSAAPTPHVLHPTGCLQGCAGSVAADGASRLQVVQLH